MRLTMLGTGNAVATHCYNTCFILEGDEGPLLVDGGGGNGLLVQLRRAHIDWMDVRHMFVTHKHLDHLPGVLWLMRMHLQAMRTGASNREVFVYGHDEVIELLLDLAQRFLLPQQVVFIGKQMHMVEVRDAERRRIVGHEFTFYDIVSSKTKLFGFCCDIGEGRRLTCCGDEALTPAGRPYAQGCDWLLHEAYCLYEDREKFRPYEKCHSTVRDACATAEELGVRNLLLYHTEDTDLRHREERYLAEGRAWFGGNLFVPDDLAVIEL